MSIIAWGNCVLNQSISSSDKVDIAFQIQKKALENKMSVLMEGNVYYLSDKSKNEYTDRSLTLLFMLIDHPLTNVAQVMFSGDGVKVRESGQRVDTGESLNSRLSRVQDFLSSILSINMVTEITFHLDGDVGDNDSETLVEISIKKFKDILVNQYSDHNGLTPSVSYLIRS